jgi:hypothetical protein
MVFVVTASSRQPGSLGAFRAEKTTAKAAPETARDLIEQGLYNVTITDGRGRVYAPQNSTKSTPSDGRIPRRFAEYWGAVIEHQRRLSLARRGVPRGDVARSFPPGRARVRAREGRYREFHQLDADAAIPLYQPQLPRAPP